MLGASKADQMLLETLLGFGANALLFSTDRKPTVFPHSLKNGGSGQKADLSETVSIG